MNQIRVEFQSTVIAPVRRLGRTLKRYVLVEGLCRLAALFLLVAFVQFALDRLLRLGVGPRAALLVCALALFVRQLWHWVLQPSRIRIDPADVAALIERRHPELQDRLVSAVAFSEAAVVDPSRDSPAMIDAIIRQAAGGLLEVPMNDLLRHQRYHRFLVLGIAALIVAIGTTILAPHSLGVFLARNLALRDVPWPSNTQITLEGFSNRKMRWPLGDDLTLTAIAHGEVPPSLRAQELPQAGEGAVRDMIRRGENQFVLDHGPLMQSIKVRFLIWTFGVDERTDWYEIEAVERPGIKQAEIQIIPPSYTALDPFVLARGQTGADVLRGSRIRIRAVVNKPLKSAVLRTAERVAAKAGLISDARVEAEFEPASSGTYFFDLLDRDDLADTRPVTYAFHLVADPPPKVRLTLPGTGELVVANAVPQLVVEAEDNLGMRSIERLHRVTSESGAAPASQPVEVAEPLPGLAARQSRYALNQSWPLQSLGLKPGDQLSVQVRAADYQPSESSSRLPASSRPASAAAGVGESVAYTFRIVAPEELLAELGRRENEWRREFEQIIKVQEQIQKRLADIHRLSAADVASAQTAIRLSQEEQAQRQLAGRVKTVRRQFEQILAELKVNQLDNPMVRRRLDGGVISPLGRLITQDIPETADLIDRIRRGSAPALADQLEEAQARIVQTMYAVLAQMLKWEGYNEAVALLRDITRLQGDLNQQTQRRMEREVERLFESPSTSRPTTQPKEAP